MHRIEAYVTLGVIFIILISIIYLPFLIFQKKKGKSVIRQISYLGLICALFLIVFATILFIPITFTPDSYVLNLNPFTLIEEGEKRFIVEVIPNILLFIPYGLFIPIVFSKFDRLYKTLSIVLVTTISIEIFQYFIGRSADIVDIISNFIGGLIGYFVYFLLNKTLNRNKYWKEFTNK